MALMRRCKKNILMGGKDRKIPLKPLGRNKTIF